MENKISEETSSKVIELLDKLKPILIELKNILPEEGPDETIDFESQFENKQHAATIKEFFEGME